MMKIALNKLIKNEKGQAMPIVMILLLIGGLIIAPLLGFMSTGVLAGQVYEEKMDGLYAADAGIENAIWKLLNGETDPASTLTDVNGMNVTVVELVPRVETGDNTYLYTLQSTAELGGVPRAEIVTQIEAVFGGAVGAGGEGGEYWTNEEAAALSLTDEDTVIFTTQNKSEFWGREDDLLLPGTVILPYDLGALNMDTGNAAIYLDGDDVMTNPKYNIDGVHYYQDEVDGYDYLLMIIKTTQDVGTPPVEFNNNDIFKLHIDPADPQQWEAELLYTIGVDVSALSALWEDPDIILFSFSNLTATLGGTEFSRGEVIKYDSTGGTYISLFNADAILPGNPNLEVDVLAVLPPPNERLLLSFSVDPVTGSNGVAIGAEDIAIWDPDTNTINLHIGMTGQTIPPGFATIVSIVSWEVNL